MNCFNSFLLFSISIFILQLTDYAHAIESESIVGGDRGGIQQFKYFASVLGHSFQCSGSIISPDHVITAAHCIVRDGRFEPDVVLIVVGTDDYSINDPYKVTVYAKKYYLHRGIFNAGALHTKPDIAVIQLQKSLDLERNPNLMVLQLPNPELDYAGEQPIVSGIGATSIQYVHGEPVFEDIRLTRTTKLHYLTTKVWSTTDCENHLNSRRKIHLCAQAVFRSAWDGVEGVCTGDSGAPLVHNGDTLIGVLSTGPWTCDETFITSIYTRITSYIKFINRAKRDSCNHPGMVCRNATVPLTDLP